MGQNEHHLFSELINYHKNCRVSGRLGQLLDEIHRDRIPGVLGYQMLLRFGRHASCAGLAEVIDEGSESRPHIFAVG